MRVEYEYPPMYDEINARFKITGKPILFAFGDIIFNPMRIAIPAHLQAHEELHGWRQLQCEGGVEQWWTNYIWNDDFRLEEEILAHQVEYRTMLRMCPNRANRRGALKVTAKKLAAPLYGHMISRGFAEKLLLTARP